MKSYSMGIVGCGKISENHIKAAQSLGIKIAFLVDINLERINQLITIYKLNSVRIYNNYVSVFKDDLNVDFVSIATSSGLHYSISKDFIDKGFNVLIEKPITLSLFEVDSLYDLSQSKRVKVAVIHPNRFIESVNILKMALDSNELGTIFNSTLNIRLNRGADYFNQAKWRGTWDLDGGGILMNQGLHNIDLFLWLLNLPINKLTSIIKNLYHPYIEAEDLAISTLEFQNGALGLIEATTNIYKKNYEESLVIFGSKGTVKLSGKSLSKIEFWDTEMNPNVIEPHTKFNISSQPDLSNLHVPVFKDFLECIKVNKEPKVTIHEAKKSLELIYAIYLSALNNQSIYFPAKNIDSKFFKGKFKWK